MQEKKGLKQDLLRKFQIMVFIERWSLFTGSNVFISYILVAVEVVSVSSFCLQVVFSCHITKLVAILWQYGKGKLLSYNQISGNFVLRFQKGKLSYNHISGKFWGNLGKVNN